MPDPREPATPPRARRAQLRSALAELVAQAGPERLLAAPVVPDPAWFPEAVRRTRGGVVALLRRLAWHAGEDRTIEIVDERLGAPPTERRPATRVVLTIVRPRELAVYAHQQALGAFRQSYEAVTTVAEGLAMVDSNTLNVVTFRHAATGTLLDVFEYGAGDTSVGAIYLQGTTTVAGVINDLGIESCTLFAQ